MCSIPLPPPRHNADCLCERCFALKINPDYSVDVLSGLAGSLGRVFDNQTTVWFLWVINKYLPNPLEDPALQLITSGAEQSKPQPAAMSLPAKPSEKKHVVEVAL